MPEIAQFLRISDRRSVLVAYDPRTDDPIVKRTGAVNIIYPETPAGRRLEFAGVLRCDHIHIRRVLTYVIMDQKGGRILRKSVLVIIDTRFGVEIPHHHP